MGQLISVDGHFKARVATPLYGVRPQGVGTGAVESLHSYLLTLAFEHSLSANVFVREMLGQCSRALRRPPIPTWGWDKEGGRHLLDHQSRRQDGRGIGPADRPPRGVLDDTGAPWAPHRRTSLDRASGTRVPAVPGGRP